jgi:hypothetical protein
MLQNDNFVKLKYLYGSMPIYTNSATNSIPQYAEGETSVQKIPEMVGSEIRNS